MKKSLRMLAVCALLLSNDANRAIAKPLNGPMNETVRDELLNLDFRNQLKPNPTGMLTTNRLCSGVNSHGVANKPNSKTIRELLGPKLKSIDIIECTNFETRALFDLARQAISNALQKSPKMIYGYEPWANAVHPDFVAKLNYEGGKSGELLLTYGYICFQDFEGKHWWARYTNPEDLNYKQINGVLKFESAHGYFLQTDKTTRIWLQLTLNKVLLYELQELLNKSVIVTGELRTVPKDVTTGIPSGEDYFVYGFKIAAVKK